MHSRFPCAMRDYWRHSMCLLLVLHPNEVVWIIWTHYRVVYNWCHPLTACVYCRVGPIFSVNKSQVEIKSSFPHKSRWCTAIETVIAPFVLNSQALCSHRGQHCQDSLLLFNGVNLCVRNITFAQIYFAPANESSAQRHNSVTFCHS